MTMHFIVQFLPIDGGAETAPLILESLFVPLSPKRALCPLDGAGSKRFPRDLATRWGRNDGNLFGGGSSISGGCPEPTCSTGEGAGRLQGECHELSAIEFARSRPDKRYFNR